MGACSCKTPESRTEELEDPKDTVSKVSEPEPNHALDEHCVPPRPEPTEYGTNSQKDPAQEEIMSFLAEVQLFKRLPDDTRPLLATAFVSADFPGGEIVIRQGDPGAEFFVIKSGQASVVVQKDSDSQGIKVATLKVGDYFGENALLRDEPRTATITAETDLCTFKISREKFQELRLNEKLHFPNRKAVGGGARAGLVTKPPSPKTDKERELIAKALRANPNLAVMSTLEDDKVNKITDVAWKESVEAGKEIIKERDIQADYFYIVQEGSFEIFVASGTQSSKSSVEEAVSRGSLVSTVSPGGSFGELALLYQAPRAATVMAKVSSVVWVIDRYNFKKILMQGADADTTEYVNYLSKASVLKSLHDEEKAKLAKTMIDIPLTKGDNLPLTGKTFCILYKGKVNFVKGDTKKELAAGTKPGEIQVFGDKALLGQDAEEASAEVVSDDAFFLAIDRDAFEGILGSLSEINKQHKAQGSKRKAFSAKQQPNKGKAEEEVAKPAGPGTRYHLKDLKKLGLLGCGGFGAVELYEHPATGSTFAMKSISKGYIVQTGMQTSVVNEKVILLMLDSPFIVRLYETYNSPDTLHFLLEPALGGELYATYIRKGFYGSLRHARFYAAGVVLAFEHMHAKKIIYRDLKPENILITESGHFKLTDMGLATQSEGKAYTTCGTPDYFAPEMVSSTGHTQAVDWWTLGILIFELLSGHAPFEASTPMQTFSKVMKGIAKVSFPKACQGSASQIIKALLQKEPNARLAMKPGGVANIKKHAWYADFEWEQMIDQTLAPPYKPSVKSKKDIANFAVSKEDLPPVVKYDDDGSGWDKDFATL